MCRRRRSWWCGAEFVCTGMCQYVRASTQPRDWVQGGVEVEACTWVADGAHKRVDRRIIAVRSASLAPMRRGKIAAIRPGSAAFANGSGMPLLCTPWSLTRRLIWHPLIVRHLKALSSSSAPSTILSSSTCLATGSGRALCAIHQHWHAPLASSNVLKPAQIPPSPLQRPSSSCDRIRQPSQQRLSSPSK